MCHYEHTQSGTLIRVAVGVWVLASGCLAMWMLVAGMNGAAIFCGLMSLLLAMILALFHSLTVRVSPGTVALAFGIGLIQKKFDAREVQNATTARHRWYNGWGIRKISGGWLYNVSGWDVVEIQLKNGQKYYIGTDQPQELLAAVEAVISTVH